MKSLFIILVSIITSNLFGQNLQEKELIKFVPKSHVIFEKIKGDLNKDGFDDVALIIKATDKSKFIKDEYRGVLDRNRRGIIILLNKKNRYEVVTKNYSCFSSENEDGGVYFAPELSVEIKKGNLYVHYGHGRYGFWKYTFKLKNIDLELIGYDSSYGGPIIESETSINFLTKKKLERVNTNEEAEGGDEVFKETWSKITLTKILKLSEIVDFDNLEFN